MSFKLDKYDNYISIGYNCFSAMLLNNLKLREKAYPLDWVNSSPEYILKYFKTNFENYYLPNETATVNYLGQQFVWERQHKMAEANDYHCENNISDNSLSIYEDNRNKYERRITRINNLLNTKESILFIYSTEYTINSRKNCNFEKKMKDNEDKYHNDLVELKKFMSNKYPNKKIDILTIYFNSKNKYPISGKINDIFVHNVNLTVSNDSTNRKNVTELLRPIF
jgi:hypothetical protein